LADSRPTNGIVTHHRPIIAGALCRHSLQRYRLIFNCKVGAQHDTVIAAPVFSDVGRLARRRRQHGRRPTDGTGRPAAPSGQLPGGFTSTGTIARGRETSRYCCIYGAVNSCNRHDSPVSARGDRDRKEGVTMPYRRSKSRQTLDLDFSSNLFERHRNDLRTELLVCPTCDLGT
jgi:hypothetical protein